MKAPRVPTRPIPIRLSESLIELIDNYILVDTHTNRSDFIRDAIREKIRNDHPELFKELIEKKTLELKNKGQENPSLDPIQTLPTTTGGKRND